MIGCSSEKKKYGTIDLREYLPIGEVGTIYVSQFNFNKSDKKEEIKTILDRTKNCVTFKISLIKNGQKESTRIDSLCASKNKLYRKSAKEEPLIDLDKKEWYSSKMFSSMANPNSEMPCKINDTSTIKIDKKMYETVTVECKAKNSTFLISYAKTFGRVKVEQKVKDFGVIGNILIKKINVPKENS